MRESPGPKTGAGRHPSASRSASPASSKPLPIWKKILFAAVACAAVMLLAEGTLAILGVKPTLFERDPYVGFSGHIPLFVRDDEAKEPGHLVTARNKQRLFNVQRFTMPKPHGTFRIFCIGGSTTYGHPYQDATSFAGWLRAMLPVADPAHPWEVINCGGISYATYREAVLMEELIRYQPDLFIVLTGQNEFLEHRTYGNILSMPAPLRTTGALLSHTRVHAVLKGALESLSRKQSTASLSSNLLPAEVETLLEHVVGPRAYHRDDRQQQQVMEHYRYNLARMAGIAHAAGARVIFVNPASNLRDCSPFKSEHRDNLSEPDLRRWQELVQKARAAAVSSRWNDALTLIDQAAAIDDRHADLHYSRGRMLWELQRHDEARAAFIRARDEDVCPLRALTPMLGMMAEVAAGQGEALVDFDAFLRQRAEHGTPGGDWFLDHVHPTIEGNRQIALALLETMRQRGWVHTAASWNEAAALAVKQRVEATITPREHGVALCTLAKVLSWAGKHEDAYRVAIRATEQAPQEAECFLEAGKDAGHLERNAEAQQLLEKALELRPDFVEAHALLGNILAARGQFDEAVGQCRAALQRRPDDAELHCSLGGLLQRQNKTSEALASFREAVRLSPTYAEAHNNLAWLLKDQGQLTEALAHFREAVRLKPGLPVSGLGLAWLLATHPDDTLRDPKQAVTQAEKLAAQSEFNNWMAMDTLAAAYASAGRFDEATRAASKALMLAQKTSPTDAVKVSERLAFYQNRRAYRETSQPPSP